LAPLHWLLGLALNFEWTPSGRGWHDQHTYFDMPVQYGFVPQLVFALILGSIALGRLSSQLYGWLLFGGVPVVALVGYFVAMLGYFGIRLRRQLRSVADRKEFAAGRGWLYERMSSDLGLRWQDLFGKKAADTMRPFGVLADEVEGLPFTAFDSEPGGPETRRTYWAIHLPVAYPRVQVHASRQNWPDDLRAETANTAFGLALLTPQVRSATVALGLVGWRIEGRDLILERQPDKPYTANEVAQVAVRLAELTSQLPTDLASRFGAPPSTDIPLRGTAGAARKRE